MHFNNSRIRNIGLQTARSADLYSIYEYIYIYIYILYIHIPRSAEELSYRSIHLFSGAVSDTKSTALIVCAVGARHQLSVST